MAKICQLSYRGEEVPDRESGMINDIGEMGFDAIEDHNINLYLEAIELSGEGFPE